MNSENVSSVSRPVNVNIIVEALQRAKVNKAAFLMNQILLGPCRVNRAVTSRQRKLS